MDGFRYTDDAQQRRSAALNWWGLSTAPAQATFTPHPRQSCKWERIGVQRTGPVRIEHRDKNRVRCLGWHAQVFETIVESLITDGATGEVALVSVETGEVLMLRPLPPPKSRTVIAEPVNPETSPDA
jgi:hypothetical protein